MTGVDDETAGGDGGAVIAAFEDTYGFTLDDFQRRALEALAGGRSVLVAAPTGAGKTVVGEFACDLAVRHGGKSFYTTPVKALSNQKYRDLIERYGSSKVGLLTGDRSLNGEAPVVVMTTEVLRNMIYEASDTLDGLRYVVLDEVHYLADVARGAVWEEIITQLRASAQLVALSATVSNAEELGDWLTTVRHGGCEVIIEERRPVPLRHHYYVNDTIHPTFVSTKQGRSGKEQRDRAAQALGGVPNPKVLMLEKRATQRRRGPRGGRDRVRLRWPGRPTVVDELARRRWLPAIMFVFSRRGCEDAVEQILSAGVRLTRHAERRRIREIAEEAVADISDEDLAALDYGTWVEGLEHGVAAHHAGMVPAFKEAVEGAFQEGLLKVVVATETLALGINMPAKSVVIERLEKWNGERHVLLTPGDYTQLTGRAGRRGIDPVGHAIVLYQRDIDFRTVAGLVGTRAYPLESSFAPSYNMVVNLLRRHDLDHAEQLLTDSFAQFQADRSVTGVNRRLVELEDGLEGYLPHLHCERGDWAEYWGLRQETSRREKREAKRGRRDVGQDVRERIARFEPGDVVLWPSAPRRGLVAVVGHTTTSGGTVLARVVTEDRTLARLGPRDVDAPPDRVGRIDLPTAGGPRKPTYRAEIASRLRNLTDPEHADSASADVDEHAHDGSRASRQVRDLHRRLREHPCHACPDREDHEIWQYRADDVKKEAERLRRQIRRRTGSLVREFHRVLDVLARLGYVDETPAPTAAGMRLARIYADADLVVAECLREGIFDGLHAAELTGLCALFVYESRSDDITPIDAAETGPRNGPLDGAVRTALAIADRIRASERQADVTPLRDLDPGFVGAAVRWARGADLDEALGSLDLTGGDFVRTVKMVADLVGQLRDAGDSDVATAANSAVSLLRRGVVEA